MRDRSIVRYGAAGVQVAEAAGVLAASVLSAVDTAEGKSYQVGSGVALSIIGFAFVAALIVVALGLARSRSWSWTPCLLVQIFTLIVGIYLLQGHRYAWGAPAVVLAVGCAVLLMLPSSLDSFGRRASPR